MKLIIVLAFMIMSFHAAAEVLNQPLIKLQQQWAEANYQTDQAELETVFEALQKDADELIKNFPAQAEALIWKAIILSTDAGKNGGFSALSKVKQARELLLKAEKINPEALEGSIYTSLGSLYYQVPGWPIGFGDDEQAKVYLQKALRINPEGIDANYFYADFLLQQGDVEQAKVYFNKALKAPPRKLRPLADQGRKAEIEQKLKQIQQQS